MTYLTPTKKKNKFFFNSPAFLLFGILFLISILFFGFGNFIFVNTASFFHNVFGDIYLFSYLKSKNVLIEENNILKAKIDDLISQNADRNALYEENLKLREKGENTKYIFADVLMKPGFSPYDYLVINIGERDGVQVGKKVFINNLVVGEVISVESNISHVNLFSSSGTKFQALVGPLKIEAQALGQGGGVFLAMLPKGVLVEEGDAVFLPEKSSKVFGFVSGIFSSDADAFQKVFFSLPVNIYQISNVLVEI